MLFCRHEIFPEFWNFHDLRGHSRGNRRSDLIFYGGGTIYSVCLLSVSNAGTARHMSSQASGVYTMSTFTSIYYNSLIFCIVCVCTSLLQWWQKESGPSVILSKKEQTGVKWPNKSRKTFNLYLKYNMYK